MTRPLVLLGIILLIAVGVVVLTGGDGTAPEAKTAGPAPRAAGVPVDLAPAPEGSLAETARPVRTAAPTKEEAAPTSLLRVRVVRAKDGTALAGVPVKATWDRKRESITGTTGNDGWWEVPFPPARWVDLEAHPSAAPVEARKGESLEPVRKRAYAKKRRGSNSPHGNVEILLRARAAGTVSGRVLDESGLPFPGITVAAWTAGGRGGPSLNLDLRFAKASRWVNEARLAPLEESFAAVAITDSDGRFVLQGIRGVFSLCALAEGRANLRTARINLGAGDRVNDVVLRLGPARSVVVQVNDSFGAPEWDFTVWAFPVPAGTSTSVRPPPGVTYDERPFGLVFLSESSASGNIVLEGLARRPYRVLVTEGQKVHWKGTLAAATTLIRATVADD